MCKGSVFFLFCKGFGRKNFIEDDFSFGLIPVVSAFHAAIIHTDTILGLCGDCGRYSWKKR